MQRWHSFGQRPAQLQPQQIREQVMVTEPRALSVERHHERVRVLQVQQDPFRARLAGQQIGQLAADAIEQGGAQQQLLDVAWLALQHFGDQIISDRAVAAGELGDEPLRVGMIAQGELLDMAAELRAERCRRAKAEAAARDTLREREREAARQWRLDELAKNLETAWAEAKKLIGTKVPTRYDEAVALLADLRELARRDGRVGEFDRRLAALREEHQRKPSLIARMDRAGLSARDAPPGTRGSR